MDYKIIYYYYDSKNIYYIEDNDDELKTLDKLKLIGRKINFILLGCLKIMKTLIQI
jgi:hypothetical protein